MKKNTSEKDLALIKSLRIENAKLKKKADSWDKLYSKIEDHYNKYGENDEDDGGGLITIGEYTAMAFGFL